MLQDLVEPVHELDVRVAAQLAEHGGAFDRLVGERVELAEQGGARDLSHGGAPVFGAAGTRCRAQAQVGPVAAALCADARPTRR